MKRAVLLALLALGCNAGESNAPKPVAPEPVAVAPSAAPARAPAASGLGTLRAMVGKYPRDVQLFDTEPLHGRLVALLGDRYATFVANMGTQGPISADGSVLYVLGNKPHAGGDAQAILLVDLDQDLIHVHLLDESEMAELRERDAEIAWPEEVQATIANWQELARDDE